MYIKGHFEKMLDVDIDDNVIIGAAISIAIQKNEKLMPFDHIDEDGYWQKYIGTHPHNGDDMYDIQRKATKKEIEFSKFIEELRKLKK